MLRLIIICPVIRLLGSFTYFLLVCYFVLIRLAWNTKLPSRVVYYEWTVVLGILVLTRVVIFWGSQMFYDWPLGSGGVRIFFCIFQNNFRLFFMRHFSKNLKNCFVYFRQWTGLVLDLFWNHVVSKSLVIRVWSRSHRSFGPCDQLWTFDISRLDTYFLLLALIYSSGNYTKRL